MITLTGSAQVNLEIGSDYVDEGATANDNIDGDITASIIVSSNVDTNTVGTYTVTYNVSDAAGNVADEISRIIIITPDVTKPVITLLGDSEIRHEQGTEYIDAGATATDNIDGDITDLIIISSNVDSNVSGRYTVTYFVIDSAGNEAKQKIRVVNVSDTTKPVIVINGNPETRHDGVPNI